MDAAISQPLPVSARITRGSWVVIGIFAVCIVGTWLWFNAFVEKKQTLRRISLATHVNGYAFTAKPLSKTEETVLVTTNYINGVFGGSGIVASPEVMAFLANWDGGDESLKVLVHSPDICWSGAGWRAVNLGQPRQLEIPVKTDPAGQSSTPLLFECRVMEAPNGHRELVIWSALVGGENLAQTHWFSPENNVKERGGDRENKAASMAASRRLRAGYFVTQVLNRESIRGPKQFVRLSTPVSGGWEKSMGTLQSFIAESLLFAEKTPST